MVIEDKSQDRQIILAAEIDEDSIKKAIDKILSINYEDSRMSKLLGDNYKVDPITLVVSTYGGEVHPGLALIGAIESIETPVVTVALGAVYSMGLPIFISGDQRVAHRYSTFMYHEMSTVNFGNLEELKTNIVEQDKVQDILDRHIVEKTDIPKKKLQEVKKKKDDWYFHADEALKIGVVDAVIGRNGKVTTKEELKKKTTVRRKVTKRENNEHDGKS